MRPNPAIRAALLAASTAAMLAVGSAAAAEPEAEAVAPTAGVDAAEAALLDEDPLHLEPDPLFDEDGDEAEFQIADSEARDPWEPLNRGVFRFNRGLDTVFLDPVTRGYQLLVPEFGRRAVERVFLNLDTPVIFTNQMLQLRALDAACTLGRFVINSSVGVAGLFDPAAAGAGLRRTEADFGQTLAFYGTPSGPYLILPVFGPSTARDAFGDVVDVMTDPLTYVLGPFRWWTLALGGSEGLVVFESNVENLRQLEAGSVDFYSALRSAYLQSRDAEIRAVRGESS